MVAQKHPLPRNESNKRAKTRASSSIIRQAPQNAELVEPAGALAAIEALYSFMSDTANNRTSSIHSTGSSVLHRAQQNCTPARYKIDPDFRKTYLVIQVTCAKAWSFFQQGWVDPSSMKAVAPACIFRVVRWMVRTCRCLGTSSCPPLVRSWLPARRKTLTGGVSW